MNKHKLKELSIQINLSGLSFCVLNKTDNRVELLISYSLSRKMTPFELLEELKFKLEEHSINTSQFENVICLYQNELSTLVPDELFKKDHLADYLKFNAKILKSDFLTYDKVESSNSVNVYVPLVNINNYIFETFGSFIYKHASTVLIDTVLNLPTQGSHEILYIHISMNQFEIVLSTNRKLVYYNTFEFSTKEDFIYYVLFTIEQLELDPEKIDTRLLGNVNENDSLFEIIYTYVRHVEIIHLNTLYQFEDSINDEEQRQNFVLLNSFES